MEITLIRHTSVAIEPGICYGQSDVSISSGFKKEANAVRSKLLGQTFDCIYSSPLSRCLQLADYCGYSNPVIDKRLMEIDFGTWEMKRWSDIEDPQLQRWFDDWLAEKPTRGESFNEMIRRVNEFISEIESHSYQKVAIFTHTGVIRAACIINKQFSAAEAFNYKVEYGDCIKIII